MTEYIVLSEDAFAALFKPVANHLDDNASFDWGDGFGSMFETYGEELEYVQNYSDQHIWTLIDGDARQVIISGFHLVNRIGYFITENPVPDDIEIEVPLDEVGDQETNQLKPTEE